MKKEYFKNKRVARYVRISKDTGDKNEENQLKGFDEWAKKYNYTFTTRPFMDLGYSRDKKKPSWEELLEECREGKWDVILVRDIIRWGVRDGREAIAKVEELSKCGVELWTTHPEQNLTIMDTAAMNMAVITLLLAGGASTEELRNKALRSIQGRKRMALEGKNKVGYPAYGYDYMVYNEKGEEKYRIVYLEGSIKSSRKNKTEGCIKRLKIYPDGRQEEHFGKNNMPKMDATDYKVEVLTIVKERIEIVKGIFNWYLNESISYKQIATRLNKQNVKPLFTNMWIDSTIRTILNNPIYTGVLAGMKTTSGRFWRYRDGKEILSPNGDPDRIYLERTPPEHWIIANRSVEPIISKEVFEAVQNKIPKDKKGYRPPKDAQFYLKPFMVCGGCGNKMRCRTSFRKTGNTQAYQCPTSSQYGTEKNPSGCGSNTIRDKVVNLIVEDWLNSVKLEMIDMRLIPLSSQMKIKSQKFSHIYSQMNEYIVKHLGEDERNARLLPFMKNEILDEYDRMNFAIECLYQEVWVGQLENRTKQIYQLQERKQELLDKFVLIEKSCAKLLADQINEAERQINELTNELNLSKELAYAERELKEIYGKFGEVKSGLKNASHRRKTELLKKVIKEVKLYFSPKKKINKSYITKLIEVEIVPRSELLPVACYDEDFIRQLEHSINKVVYSTKNLRPRWKNA